MGRSSSRTQVLALSCVMTALIAGCGDGDTSTSQQVSAGRSETAASERTLTSGDGDVNMPQSGPESVAESDTPGPESEEGGSSGTAASDADNSLDCPPGSFVSDSVGTIAPEAFDRPGTAATPQQAIERFRRVESRRPTASSRAAADFRYVRTSLTRGDGDARPENRGHARFVGLRENGSVAIKVGVVQGGKSGTWIVGSSSRCEPAPSGPGTNDSDR